MRTLYLLRHGAAAAQSPEGDRGRPLDAGGRRDVARLAAYLAERRIAPDLVLSSPSLRTRETVALAFPGPVKLPDVRNEEGIYLAAVGDLLERLREVPADTPSVMLVGHNPGLHELALLIAGVGDHALAQGFPAAALAVFAVETGWAELGPRCAILSELVTPKHLAQRYPGS